MWTSLNKKLYLFLSIILVIGLIVGIVFVVTLDESLKEIIFLNINEMMQNFNNIRINNLVIHIIILSVLFVLSIFIIGVPFIAFFIFYNGFSIGFIIACFTLIFGIKGLLYGIIYTLISKGLFLIFLFILGTTYIKISKSIMEKIIYKAKNKDTIILLVQKSFLCIGIILIIDIISYLGSSKLINVFNFIIN